MIKKLVPAVFFIILVALIISGWQVTVNNPSNSFNTTNTTVTVSFNTSSITTCNCTVYTNTSGTWINVTSIWSLTGVNITNNSYYTFTSLSEGLHWYRINCTNGIINVSSTNNFFVDLTNPKVHLNSPANGYSNGTFSMVRFNATAADNHGLQNCSLYGNFSGTWAKNQTRTVIVNNSWFNFTANFSEGTYKWNVKCYDTAGNRAFNSSNRTFLIDVLAPRIYYYINQSFIYYNNSDIAFPFTRDGSYDSDGEVPLSFYFIEQHLGVCKLYANFNGTWAAIITTTHTLWPLWNMTNSPIVYNVNRTLADGAYKWNVWCIDTYGHSAFNSTNYTFTVDTIYPGITINLPNASAVLTGTNAHLNYSLNETPDTVWYVLDGASAVIIGSAQYDNLTINLAYPGKHSLILYANDSTGRQTSATRKFYSVIPLDVTAWWAANDNYNPNVTSFTIRNTSTLSGNISINQRLSMWLGFDNALLKILNFTGLNVSWYKHFYAYDQKSSFESDVRQYLATDVIRFVMVENMSYFLTDDSYNASLNFTINDTDFTHVWYCTNSSATSCSKITAQCGHYAGTNCYNSTPTYTVIYTDHMSGVLLANDSIKPNINVTTPKNNHRYNQSYKLQLNFSTNELATCRYKLNKSAYSGSYVSTPSGWNTLRTSFSTTFNQYSKGHKLSNITINCTDASGNWNTTTIRFNVTDKIHPTITEITVDGDTYDGGILTVTSTDPTIKVYTNEPSLCAISVTDDLEFNDSESMDAAGDKLSHTYSTGQTSGTAYYYAKCKDYYLSNYMDTSEEITIKVSITSNNNDDSAGSSAATATTTNKAASVQGIFDLSPASPLAWSIKHSQIPINRLDATFKATFDNSQITVSKLIAKPAGTGAFSYLPYAYLQIETQGIVAVGVSSVKIQFTVPRSWINQNNITKVDMIRWYSAKWDVLPTTLKSQGLTNSTYEAISPGFSYFTIVGEQPASATTTTLHTTTTTVLHTNATTTTSTTSTTIAGADGKEGSQKMKPWMWWLFGIILAAGLGFYFFYENFYKIKQAAKYFGHKDAKPTKQEPEQPKPQVTQPQTQQPPLQQEQQETVFEKQKPNLYTLVDEEHKKYRLPDYDSETKRKSKKK